MRRGGQGRETFAREPLRRLAARMRPQPQHVFELFVSLPARALNEMRRPPPKSQRCRAGCAEAWNWRACVAAVPIRFYGQATSGRKSAERVGLRPTAAERPPHIHPTLALFSRLVVKKGRQFSSPPTPTMLAAHARRPARPDDGGLAATDAAAIGRSAAPVGPRPSSSDGCLARGVGSPATSMPPRPDAHSNSPARPLGNRHAVLTVGRIQDP